MSNEQEQFEAWYTEHYTSYLPKTGGGVYCNMDTLLAWKSWQAALSAVSADGGKESASDARDAERYRWLKINCFDTEEASDGDAFGYPSLHFESDELQCHNADSLDSAIDAAIAGETE